MSMQHPIRRRAAALAAVLLAGAVCTALAAPVAEAAACATTPLNLTWDSSKTTGLIVDLHIRTSGATVTWGDGTSTAITTMPSASTSHTYAAGGVYTISVCVVISFGKFVRTWTNNRGASGFTAVTSFASTLTDLGGAFVDWTNLTDVPAAIPLGVTTLASAFYGASKFNDADVSTWSTANVTSLAQTFFGATLFNRPLNNWNTAKNTSLVGTFFNAAAFNQPLNLWNTALVTDMTQTFQGAAIFDQNIGAWNTAKVTKLAQMFAGALVFNNGGSDTIKNWNLAANTSLNSTFWKAKKFNQPIGSWNTGLVTRMDNAFQMAEIFNQDLGAWNTAVNTKFAYMFDKATAFNNGGSPSINNWNTAAGNDFGAVFSDAPNFNQPLGNWNMSAATTISGIFGGASKFDQDISNWNPVGLYSATSAWNGTESVMSVANYDKLLKAWSGKTLRSAVPFGWGLHKYSCDAEPARIKMASAPISWTMTDGGLSETAPSISTIVPGNGTLAVYVTAPTCMSSQRTSYQYSTDGGTTWVTVSPASLASPITIAGLDNGTAYSIKVRLTGGTIGILPTTAKASAAMSGTPVFDGAGVTAKNETSVYGAAVPTVGYTTTLATGDWVDTVNCGAYTDNTYATEVTSTTKPGTYVTHCTGSTTSGLGSDVKYTDGVYTVTKAPLSITASSLTKTYGDALTLDGTDDFTVSGLAGSDDVDSVTLTTLGDAASANVAGSVYAVVPSAAVGAASKVLADWYTITYNNGTITVNEAAALSVTPKTYTIDLGGTSLDSTPLGFDVTGFVNSESFATTGYTAPTCDVYDGGTLQSPPYSTLSAGVYTIKCSGGSAANYATINYSEAKFVVKSANVEVVAKSPSSTYGAAPAADPGYEVAGDLSGASVSCKVYTDDSYTVEVTDATMPGTYVTHCEGPANNGSPDFTPIEYVDGEFTVEKAALTITAASFTKTYGDELTLDGDDSDGSADFTVSGLQNSDHVLTVTLTSSGDAATAGVAGSLYSVVPSAASLDCECDLTDLYDVTYVNGTITVKKKLLTVEADDLTLQVGAAVPGSYDFTITGWVNDEDDETNLPAGWAAPTCASSFNSTTPIGTTVDITCSGGSADDYEFEFEQGSVSIGNPEVSVENTTQPAYETSGATANVALKATITNWAPGCKVTFTLSPSAGTASPYTVYTTASNDVSVSASLPVGVYDVTTSVSEGCEGDADTTGIVAVVPIGPGGASHVDTYGTRYRDATTGKTVVLDMEWLRKSVRAKNPTTGRYESSYVNDSYYNWSIYGTRQWRIASKPFAGTVTLGDGDTQPATVSTWGRMDCPTGMYPAGNVSICSAVTNVVMLQEWVRTGSSSGYWRNVGEVLIVERLAEGLWPYRCATLACKTPLPDYVSFQMRPVPGSTTPTVIPTGLPSYTDWTPVIYGNIVHK